MLCAPLSLVERIRRWWQRHGITKSAAKDCEVDFDKPWEEERLPNFDSTQYYPVKIAERIAGRYEILGKVGFGTSSTVWYCRDRKTKTYTVVKITTRRHCDASPEQTAYEHIGALGIDTRGPQARNLRQCLDTFTITSPAGNSHRCFVHEPVACSVQTIWDNLEDGRFHITQVKLFTRHTLLALDFLHRGTGIVHTDIKPDNIFFGFADGDALDAFAKKLKKQRLPVKYLDCGYPVHQSVGFDDLGQESWSHPVLGDLGEARVLSDGRGEDQDWQTPFPVGPPQLRAPETALGCVWSYGVDIWMLGVVILWMLDNKLPFTRRNLDDEDDLAKYIAQIHAVLGPPPEGFLKVLQDQPFWDEEGSWIHSTIALPETSLMQKLESLEESERLQTADFLLCMLKWLPTKRCTAEELLGHPWLTSLFG